MTNRFIIGIADFSYCLNKWRLKRMSDAQFLDEVAKLGAKAFQFDFLFDHATGTPEFRKSLVAQAKALGVTLTAADYGTPSVARFKRQLETAVELGVTLVRHACGPFLGHQPPMPPYQLQRILAEVAPLFAAKGVRLAIENHQDYSSRQFAEMLHSVNNPYVGIMLDTGNSIALLEDPVVTAELLAPFTFGVHLKEYAVLPGIGGFDLIGVEMGTGIIDNHRVLEILAARAPEGPLPVLLENPIERCRISVFHQPFLEALGETPFHKAYEPILRFIQKSQKTYPGGIVLPFEDKTRSAEEIGSYELEHNRRAFRSMQTLLASLG